MKTKKFSLLIIFLLALLFSFAPSFAEKPTKKRIATHRVGKIAKGLYDKMAQKLPGEKIPVAIWFKEPLGLEEVPRRELSKSEKGHIYQKRKEKFHKHGKPMKEHIKSLGYKARQLNLLPVIYTELPPKAIENISKRPNVDTVYYLPPPSEYKLELHTAVPTIKANQVWNKGYTGYGVKVAVVEVDNPDFTGDYNRIWFPHSNLNSTYEYTFDTWAGYTDHATAVAGIICSGHSTYKGVAYGVNYLFSANASHHGEGDNPLYTHDLYDTLEWAIWNFYQDSVHEHDADILNCSFMTNPGETSGDLLYWDRAFDYIVRRYYKTIVKSAGNNASNPVTTPGRAYNIITVGATYDHSTTDPSDDTLESYSAYINPNTGVEKPEVVAPGDSITSLGYNNGSGGTYWGSGTSFAAPMVSGAAALLMHQSSTLKSWPEAVKAILMASAREDITSGRSKDGAGQIDCYAAYEIVKKGRWNASTYTSSSFPKDFTFYVYKDEKVRVVIVWDSNPSDGWSTDPLQADLDLYVYNPSGSQIGSSTDGSNNHEIVEFTATTTGNYKARISKWSFTGSSEYVAIAWDINDLAGPAGSVSINSGAAYTNSTSVTLNLSASDRNGVSQMRFKNSGYSWSSWYSYATSKSWTLPSGNGTKYVYVEFKDSLGNVSQYSDSIVLDTQSPTGSISINNGATYTNSTSVTLNLSASDSGSNVAYMRFKNSGYSWSSWYSYSTSKSWTLPSGNGTKYVYVEYKDNAGNISSDYYDSIILDMTPPSGSISINNGATYTTSTSVTLNLSASGASQMRFKNDGYSWSSWYSYSTSKSWTLPSGDGTKKVWVEYKDNADNTSSYYDTIVLDTQDPTGSISINSGAAYTNSTSVTLNLSASDSGSNVSQMRFSNNGTSWSSWYSYAISKSWTIPSGEGTKYVYVQYKDSVGHTSQYSDSIILDITSPNAPTISSTSHNEYEWNITNNDPIFNWTVPSDLSGIDGFSFVLNHTQNYTPDTTKDCEETTTSEQYINVFDGIWYFHIRAKDNAGNWGATDTYGPVKIDLTAPTFPTISSSADPAKEGDITITAVASEQMSVLSASVTQNGKSPTLINMNSSDSITWIGIYTVVRGYDGTATISVSGEDLAGKPGSDLTTFLVDTIPPTKSEISSTTHPKNTPTSNSRPSFTWTDSADDGGSGVAGYSYALNQTESYDLDTAVETTSTSVSFTKPDGTWWFHLRAVDEAGNGSEIDRYKFIIDTTSPTFTAFSLKDPTKEGDVTINVQASEELKQAPTVNVKQSGQGSATTVAMNSSDNITWRGTYTVVTGYDGTAIINVSGVDLADNAGTGSGNFEVDTIAPTASISMSPTSPLKTGEFQIVLTLTDASSIPQKPSLTYTLSGGSLISVSLTGSDKSWSGSSYIDSTAPEGMAMFSFSATDVAGNRGITITAGKTFEIDTTIEASSGGTSSNSDGTMVNVPEDAFSQNVNIRITYPDPNLSEIREADNNIIDDKGIKPIKIGNLYREIVAVGDIYGNEIENSDKPVTISIPYPDEDQNGMVDGTTIEEETLRMFHLDETLKKWILVPNSQVDSTGNNVSAEISNFSIYTLMQLSAPSSLSEVFGYPNPCYVKKDGYVRISNIPLDAKHVKIYIYNVAGELVRILEEEDEIETQAGSKLGKWDGRNENNEMVASGIYIYLIKSEGSKKIEKIAIFW